MNPNPITFISFCVDIGRGSIDPKNTIHRPFELYKSGMVENIETKVPLVMYSSVKDLVNPSHRNESNFRYYYYDTESIQRDFPNFNEYVNYYPHTHKDEIESILFYYTPLVVLKMKKVMEVIEDNPFNSDYFFWMDCFFTRGIVESGFLHNQEDYIKMSENVKNKLGDKFVLLNFANRPFGFFWGGNKTAMENVYKHYFDIFFEFLPTKLMTEELIFKEINERYPDLMSVIDVENGDTYKIACQNFLTK